MDDSEYSDLIRLLHKWRDTLDWKTEDAHIVDKALHLAIEAQGANG